MRPRYLLFVVEPEEESRGRIDEVARRLGLRIALMTPRLVAMVNEHCPCLCVDERGCIVGTLFHRHGSARAVETIGTTDASAILERGEDHLLSHFWGGYVAVLHRGRSIRVVRDPSAALPCYFVTTADGIVLASDAELLVDAGLVDVQVNWAELAMHFHAAGVPSSATAISGVRELLPGFALEWPGDIGRQTPCWSPWDHAGPDDADAALAGERLARTIRHCVSSWASVHGRLLLSCSGGLDSSIVAAALAHGGADAIGITLYGDDPNGDERPFARALCDHLGLPLIERAYRLEEIDIDQPLGAHLPRPSDRTHALSYERAHLETAGAVQATAFVTGNGGDSVFGYSQSAAAAADRFLSEGLGAGVLATLRDISLQTGCGLPRAARAALRLARASRAYRCRPDSLFLDPELAEALASNPLHHPWLDAPADALPGKAAHIASILRVQQCLEPTRGRQLPVINPLMAQPVIETCLRVPSWEWRSGGRDRALARRAFSEDLPPLNLGRRVKGGPDGFAAQVLDHFRDEIRERLLDGELARQRIIDRLAVEQELGDERPSRGERRARLLEFTAAEAWIASWRARGAAAPERRRSVFGR